MQVDRVEHGPPHVVLALLVGRIADAHRPCPLVAVQMIQRPLGKLSLATHAEHDLEIVG